VKPSNRQAYTVDRLRTDQAGLEAQFNMIANQEPGVGFINPVKSTRQSESTNTGAVRSDIESVVVINEILKEIESIQIKEKKPQSMW